MDPQQRLLLECTEEAMTTAALLGMALGDADDGVGVFVGISTPDFSQVAQSHADISAYSATGGSHSAVRWPMHHPFCCISGPLSDMLYNACLQARR